MPISLSAFADISRRFSRLRQPLRAPGVYDGALDA